jgi:hypothetical protein
MAARWLCAGLYVVSAIMISSPSNIGLVKITCLPGRKAALSRGPLEAGGAVHTPPGATYFRSRCNLAWRSTHVRQALCYIADHVVGTTR